MHISIIEFNIQLASYIKDCDFDRNHMIDMATAGDGLFWSLHEGSISGYDNTFEKRPYHRKCGCALHNKKSRMNYKHMLPSCCNKTVSYPIKKERRSLVVKTASTTLSSSFSFPTNSSSQVMMSLVNLQEQEEEPNHKYF